MSAFFNPFGFVLDPSARSLYNTIMNPNTGAGHYIAPAVVPSLEVSRTGEWSPEEDTALVEAVNALGKTAWFAVGERIDRSPFDCAPRWLAIRRAFKQLTSTGSSTSSTPSPGKRGRKDEVAEMSVLEAAFEQLALENFRGLGGSAVSDDFAEEDERSGQSRKRAKTLSYQDPSNNE